MERKRVEKKEINKIEPKLREVVEEPIKDKQLSKVNLEHKYIKIPSDSKQEEFKKIGDDVLNGRLKWSYFVMENEKFYHYYQILK